MAAGGQRRDAPPHESVDHRTDRVERGGRRRKPAFGRREGVVAEGVERLLASSQKFGDPPLESLAKPGCEALPRQPQKLPDRRDAELREARDRLLADRFLAESRHRQIRQLRRLLAGRDDAKPSAAAVTTAVFLSGQNRNTPCHSWPNSRRSWRNGRRSRHDQDSRRSQYSRRSSGGGRRIRHARADVQAPRGERPHRRANDRLLAAEEHGGAGDVDVDPLGPRGGLDRHNRREPPTPPRDPLEHHPIGHGIVGFDLGHPAGLRSVRDRNRRERLGQ